MGGWTTPTPSPLDPSYAARDARQLGSRLHYISVSRGSDQTGEIYFWDGTRIIDATGKSANASGQAYGADPTNPSAAVKPFKSWGYVGPRNGASSDIGTPGTVGGATPSFRAGFPDWWLFARGETFDLSSDLLAFERKTNPGATAVNSSLAVPGGRSPTERQVVGAFGPICQARPRFIHPQLGFVSRFTNSYTPVFKNVAYLSLHFDNHDRITADSTLGMNILGQTAASTDILFEDIWFDGTMIQVGAKNAGQFRFRRSLMTDAFVTDGSHVQGIYYEGTREGVLRIEESMLMRNGFSHGDPKTSAWPPSGAQTWDMFSRNMYISGETNSMQSGVFDSVSMLGASGDQFRPGARVERNFFYQGYVLMGAHGGYADSAGPTGTFKDNVVQRFIGSGTNSNIGQPGWGFQLGGGANGVEVSRNIVTGSQHSGSTAALQLQPILQDCEVPFEYATRANLITGNILDSGSASAAVTVVDGVTPSQSCYGWVAPGVRGNAVADNTLVNSSLRESEYTPYGGAVEVATDTAYQRNRVFASRATAAAAMGWTGTERTLKTFMMANGVAVSSSDGFPEYFAQATQQRRGQWRPKWTSRELVNHFRGGFGMSALP